MANVFRLHADAVGILEDKIFGIMDDPFICDMLQNLSSKQSSSVVPET